MESGTALWMIDEYRKETRGKESRKKVIPGGQARDGERLYVSSEPAGTEKWEAPGGAHTEDLVAQEK